MELSPVGHCRLSIKPTSQAKCFPGEVAVLLTTISSDHVVHEYCSPPSGLVPTECCGVPRPRVTKMEMKSLVLQLMLGVS